MLKDLITFFETAPLSEVTAKLKKHGVEFIPNRVSDFKFTNKNYSSNEFDFEVNNLYEKDDLGYEKK
ncbi:MAG: hypothetical protein LRZ99_05430 [Desulfotomaculum sp.]|nr:hypothetical protein [Desulfotomaculum sp.]